MPLPTRMSPLGEPLAVAARGLVYGNRGCLHDSEGTIRRPFAGRRWIACRLSFRGWERGPLLQPGRFTELFFLDEATAFAAGHRPCRLCRYEDYQAFASTWATIHPDAIPNAEGIDRILHVERWDPVRKTQRHHAGRADDLPDGAFILIDGTPWVVLGPRILRWTPGGYRDPRSRPSDAVDVITPPSVVAVLRTHRTPAVPFLHPSVRTGVA